MNSHSYGLADLLTEIAEFLDGQADVVDGSYGEQEPNRAMQLGQQVEIALQRIQKLPDGPDCETCARLKGALEALLIFHSSAKTHPLHAAAREVIANASLTATSQPSNEGSNR